MKKSILVLLAIMANGVASAQWTAKAGLSTSTLSGDGYYANDMARSSFFVGLGYDIPGRDMPLKWIFIQPEVKFNSLGSDHHLDGFMETQKISTLSLGSLVGIDPNGFFRLFIGIEFGLVLDSKLDRSATILGIDVNESVDTDEFISNTTFAAPIGVSFKLMNRLKFEARYNIGLSNIAAKDSLEGEDGNTVIELLLDQYGESKIVMNGFQLGFAYQF